jgi:hypothetical protein
MTTMNGKATKSASPKQLKWLSSLIKRSWVNFDQPSEYVRLNEIKSAFDYCAEHNYGPEQVNMVLITQNMRIITMAGFDFLLEKLKDAPAVEVPATILDSPPSSEVKAQIATAKIATEDGVYKKGDTFYKLRFAKTGNLWAHRLVFLLTPEQAKAKAEAAKASGIDDKRSYVKFKFAGNPVNLGIREDMKLSYEDAKAFGALYNMCSNCGRLLTHELSVHLGIGPVCGKRQFGGEFKFMIDEAKLAVEATK